MGQNSPHSNSPYIDRPNVSGCPTPRSNILIHAIALPPNIQGGSRMRESRSYGSVRGVLREKHPYRDSCSFTSYFFATQVRGHFL